MNPENFFVTGGTLRPDAPSYVERAADRELYEGLVRGDFCYVLTSRQMGKSSLMVRTVVRLRQQGFGIAVLDLTAIGQNLTIEQWYDGLVARLGQQLDLEDELVDFWRAHATFGPLQRLLTALEEVVLPARRQPLAIFVDEIDIVRSLPFSTDEFFAGIRECYNRRARDPEFNRLTFCLLGVATPNDLIRETRMTPFNIGRRIELNDFTELEAAPLARGLSADPQLGHALLARVLYWTGGHPYLTQRLCQGIHEQLHHRPAPTHPTAVHLPPVIPTVATVDRLADKAFLSRQARERDDNLVFVRDRLLRADNDLATLLDLYRRVRNGRPIGDDETNPMVSTLRLSGITRGLGGILQVRNRIYFRVFDQDWIRTNMPEAEVRRQRKASHRGTVRGFAIAGLVLLAYLLLRPILHQFQDSQAKARALGNLGGIYRNLPSYAANFDTTLECQYGTVQVPVPASGHLLCAPPHRFRLNLKSPFTAAPIVVNSQSDGTNTWIYLPEQLQYTRLPALNPDGSSTCATALAPFLGPLALRPIYPLFLAEDAATRFSDRARDLAVDRTEDLDGTEMLVMTWNHEAAPVLRALGLTITQTTNATDAARIPVTAWVDQDRLLVHRLRLDLSAWADRLLPSASNAPPRMLVLTESYKNIALDHSVKEPAFAFTPPAGATLVRELILPARLNVAAAAFRDRVTRVIPPRYPTALPNLIDLTDHYNAALVGQWHDDESGNDLSTLPPGLLSLGGIRYDARGIVQLASRQMQLFGRSFPTKVTDIPVRQRCAQLHFLHATAFRDRDGTRVGTYVLHYADGRQHELPLIYGRDLRDWHVASDAAPPGSQSRVVWAAFNGRRDPVRLFESTYDNPFPDTEIVSIDFLSSLAQSAPFLLAVTVE